MKSIKSSITFFEPNQIPLVIVRIKIQIFCTNTKYSIIINNNIQNKFATSFTHKRECARKFSNYGQLYKHVVTSSQIINGWFWKIVFIMFAWLYAYKCNFLYFLNFYFLVTNWEWTHEINMNKAHKKLSTSFLFFCMYLNNSNK